MTWLCLLLALPALGGGTVSECRDADGRTRLTNRGCRPDETTLSEKAIPGRPAAASPNPVAPVPPSPRPPRPLPRCATRCATSAT